MAVAEFPQADLGDREQRALEQYLTVLEDDPRVRGADDLFLVVSESGSEYLVDLEGLSNCECPDSTYRNVTCKHIHRALFATSRRPIPEGVDRDVVDEQLGEHTSGEIRWG
ncbi:SWIM zinc finger family protein [Halostagnicola sp. A-GB9-2]|uniref:SWIM zinc finger family protein n=1 Tax=Halostagnicola sp. A-GB9-2 TaxID=3048066 RepID=UPI0024BF6CCD|nr:SWIM zinc finger family protein [Halostagnicola sp. A-GB9-2]MDJ1433974.1 hypothetical protein [Halostagnicola sp. A-GB9-2]